MIKVYYTPKMVASFESFSPSAAKPRLVVDSWKKMGLPIEIIEPIPVTEAQLCLAHSDKYVRAIMSCEIPNGFGNQLPEVAASFPHTVGSMLSAAREALRNETFAVAPCSGFHHAGFANSQGFCTFNGLMVTAIALKKEGLVKKVGIVDFDMHYGNGTSEIIKELNLKDWVKHFSAGADYYSENQAEDFLMRIPRVLKQMEDCDLILYQAGADPHINDPLGGWLTTKQLAERDRLVFSLAKRLGLPIAWNLAGGYQRDEDNGIRPVLEIHDNTMKECYAVYREQLSLLLPCETKLVESKPGNNTMRIPVFYTPKMVAQFEDFSPSAGKPVKVVASWQKLNIPLDVKEPMPSSAQEISLAHDPDYVNDILACRKQNGFHNMLRIVADSLPYTVGSMICAAREAIKNKQVAVAPCSGFHHASYKYNSGFCTFNGLIIAARVMLNEGLAKKVGIVDFDMHYGDGTAAIIKDLNLQDCIEHYTAGAQFLKSGQSEKFLNFIPKIMRLMEGCDVILYQAGADPHIDDPFGGWLTTEQLAVRDRLVFMEAKRLGIPIAWNLAGGYQHDKDGGIRPVLEIHDNTMKECYAIYQ